MRKTLILGALALAASTTAASAVTIVSLDGYCNAYAIRNVHGTISMKDTGCSTGFGTGVVASVHGAGKTEVVGLVDPQTTHTQFVFTFSYPLMTGGTWSLSDTTDGVHTNVLTSGHYTIPAPGERLVQPHGLKSVTTR